MGKVTKLRSMFCLAILVIVFCVPSRTFGQTNPFFYWSENNVYGARIVPAKSRDGQSQVTVLKLNSAKDGFDFFAELELEISFVPKETIITNDGRYLIALGDISDPFSRRRQAAKFSIYDLNTKKKKIYSIDNIVSQDNSGGLPESDHEFEVLVKPVEHDVQECKLYISTFSPNSPHKCPTIVVDYAHMTVVAEEPSFWKAKHDRLFELTKLRRRKTTEVLNFEQRRLLQAKIETLVRPRILHQRVGRDFLFRLVPGTETRNARVIMMKHNANTKGFDCVKVVQLRNKVAPTRRLWPISSDVKYMMTFDEIDKIGMTENSIVIYNLESGEWRAFSLDDFCSKEDLDNMAVSNSVRLWRWFTPWITFTDPKFYDLFEDDLVITANPGVIPHLSIDVEKMEVKLMEPFRSKYLSKRKKQ